ncbi:MAG: hypothetical protein H6608_09055 [Flavobacteriales bacterium]|nr:hypothetical protein [Flavobacteriales bacterium]
MPSHLVRNLAGTFALALTLVLTLHSCKHPDPAMGAFRGKYVKAGFMMVDSSLRSEIVVTSRGEVFAMEPGSAVFVKKQKLPKLKTKAVFLAVEKTGILQDHANKKGMAMTLFIEYHKRHKTYLYSWGELGWPDGVRDAYEDLVKLHTAKP